MRRFGIDVDGVLADFQKPAAAVLSALFNADVPPVANHWYWYRDHGITGDKESQFWSALRMMPCWWSSLPTTSDGGITLALLNRIARCEDTDIYFITDRPGHGMKDATERWLREHGIENPTVIRTANKGPVAAGIGLTAFIDDRPKNCEEVAAAGVPAYLLDRVWNADHQCSSGVIRVPDVATMLARYIHQLP